MLQPKKINKTDFCENDYTIKIPFLPTHITKKGKENYDAFYSLSQTKITSNNYDSWRNKFDEFLEFQIVEDCTMLINFYKKIYNSQQAEVIRNKILYSNCPILNCSMAIIFANLAETRKEIPDAHFGNESVKDALTLAQKHSLVVLQSQNLAGNLFLSFYGLPTFKQAHSQIIETLKEKGIFSTALDRDIPVLTNSPENILRRVSQMVLEQNNTDLSLKFMQNTRYDFEKHGQVILNSNDPKTAIKTCKTFGKDKLPIYNDLQKICIENGDAKDILEFARLKDANITLCANAISKINNLEVSEKFLHEHNGQFNRSIILAPILEQGGFKTKRYVKKLEKQLDKELRDGKDKGLEQSMF